MSQRLRGWLVGAVLLAGCSADVIDTPYVPYTIRLWGGDSRYVAAGSARDAFAATKSYKVTVRFFEDAEGKVPYGTSLAEKPDEFEGFNPVQTFTVPGGSTSFTLGDSNVALPRVKENGSLYVSSEVLGYGSDDKTPIARARCAVQEIKPAALAPKDAKADCYPFYGRIGQWTPVKGPDYKRRLFAAVGLRNGGVVVAGGREAGGGDNPYSKVEVYEVTNEGGVVGGKWRKLGTEATARSGLAATLADNGLVYLAGGLLADKSYSRAVNVIDLSGPGAVRDLEPLADPRNGLAIVPYKESALVMGGWKAPPAGSAAAGTPVLPADALAPGTGKPHTRLASLSEGRFAPCAARLADGRVLVCGGDTKRCEVFDGSSFSPANEMQVARRGARCVAVGSVVYIVGGVEVASEKAIEVWNPGAGVSKFEDGLSLVSHGLASSNGKVVVAGGYEGGDAAKRPLKAGFWFDPTSGLVKFFTPEDDNMLSIGRKDHELVGLPDGTVMAIGGQTDGTDTAGAELFVVPD
jgi:hypothetical protein